MGVVDLLLKYAKLGPVVVDKEMSIVHRLAVACVVFLRSWFTSFIQTRIDGPLLFSVLL